MIYYARIFILSAKVQMLEVTASIFMLFIALLQPFFIAILAIYMLRDQAGFEPVYVIVGAGLSGLFSTILFTGSNSVTRERAQGNLELLEASPAPLMVIMGGKMVANLALALTSMVVTYVVGAGMFQYPVAVEQPAFFAVSMILALFSLWTMGMLFAPLSILWQPVEQVLGGLEYPVFIFCGFLFPIALLPGWFLPISYALPPYWAARSLQGSSLGTLESDEIVLTWLILLATSGVSLVAAGMLFRIFLRLGRRKGTLGFI
ncbi:MAG: ABC transporter permease [Chloroflexi bacterium]|nr:ABC transporter permease [Chloroflexota bacterium]